MGGVYMNTWGSYEWDHRNNGAYYNEMSGYVNGYHMQQPSYPPHPQYVQVPGQHATGHMSQHGQQPYQVGAYHPFMQHPQPSEPVSGFYGQHPMQFYQQPVQGINPFENPLSKTKTKNGQMNNAQAGSNPYPKQQFMQKQQPTGVQSMLNQFKTQDGSMDLNKMVNTAGQMMNTVNQVSSMIKGVGGIFKA